MIYLLLLGGFSANVTGKTMETAMVTRMRQ